MSEATELTDARINGVIRRCQWRIDAWKPHDGTWVSVLRDDAIDAVAIAEELLAARAQLAQHAALVSAAREWGEARHAYYTLPQRSTMKETGAATDRLAAAGQALAASVARGEANDGR